MEQSLGISRKRCDFASGMAPALVDSCQDTVDSCQDTALAVSKERQDSMTGFSRRRRAIRPPFGAIAP